jgi:hypothetical protein
VEKGNTVLVTGATSGIGYELAKLFVRHGFNLVLVARSKTDLEKVAREFDEYDGVVKIIPIDLSKQNSAESIFKELSGDAIKVDVLVNNAGFGQYGEFAKSDFQKQEEMIAVNVASLTKLTRLFLPSMLEKGQGRILNVASIAAFAPGPFMAVYFATKAYVVSFSLALSEELSGTSVSVTTLCPGPTATNFQESALVQKSSLFGKVFTMDAGTVACAGYKGLMSGKRVVIPGFKNKLMIAGRTIVPTIVALKIVKFLQKD